MSDTATDLLEHSAWLRALARSLVSDASTADDVVQDTWVAATRVPPLRDRPVRPWLAHVLRNAVRFRWRGDANRAARERAVAALGDEATPSAAELLERLETQQLLARLVGELAEPFRATVLLVYAEGLAPGEVARRLGVPSGTIRSRLHEGLQRLRTRLDELHRGDRRRWMLALGPLAPRGGAPAAAVAAPPLVVWALVAAVATVLALVVLHALATPARVGEAVVPRAVSSEPSTIAVVDAPTLARVATAPAWLAQDGAPARAIAGRVTIDGAPASGVVVQLAGGALMATPDALVDEVSAPLEQRTDADGRFAFPAQSAQAVVLAAAMPGRLAAIAHVDLRDPTAQTDDLELVLRSCDASLSGTIVDASGVPIAHAQVRREDTVGVETDATGAYELCVVPYANSWQALTLVVRAEGYGTVVLATGLDGPMHHDFVLIPEAIVTGRATADGEPVPHARVSIDRDGGAKRRQEFAPSQIVFADADGRFRVAGLTAGVHVVRATARGLSSSPLRVTLVPGASQDLALALGPTAIVRGTVTRAGVPVACARVAIAVDPIDDAVSQADGTFVLDNVPIGSIAFTASPYRMVSPAVAIAAGDANHVALEVAPLGSVTGIVRRHGEAVPDARVCAGLRDTRNVCAYTDGRGRYELAGLVPGAYTLFADSVHVGAFARDVHLTIDAVEQRTLDVELSAGARVDGHVVDAAGAPVSGVLVRLVQSGTPHLFSEGRCMTGRDGGFACASLEPGTYTAAVYTGTNAAKPLPFARGEDAPAPLVVADGDAHLGGVRIAIDATRFAIEGTLADATGTPISDAQIRVRGEGPDEDLVPPSMVATGSDGRFAIAELAPGAYEVEAHTIDGATVIAHGVVAGTATLALVLDTARCHGTAPTAITTRAPARLAWDDAIELVGWSAPARVALGKPFDVSLTYRVLRPIDRAWTVFVHFDGTGANRARRLADHDPTCATQTWRPGDYVVERFTTTIDGVAPGTYALATGFFAGTAPTWINLPISDAPDAMRDHAGIAIGSVVVE